MKKLFHASWLTFIVCANLLIVSFGWLYIFDGNPAATIKNIPMPTRAKEYRHGDVVEMFADYCKLVDAPTDVIIQFVDGIVFEIGESSRQNAPVGCAKEWFPIVRVPDKLPPGEYYLRGQSTFQVNFLRQRTVEWRTEWFKILPSIK